jgi:exodeoxyribonuclease V beta subunit
MSGRAVEIPALAIGDAPLAGTIVVEASAGTGKTWTIAALVVRLVLERGLSIRDVLVVTFTEAATAELRTRIRERLVDLRRALAEGTVAASGGKDALLAWIAGALPVLDRDLCVRRLDAAVNDFDLAPIHTIHAFCQRALDEHAFESGQPFAAQLVPDESRLVAEAVADFWRRDTADAAPEWSAWLRARGVHPASLAKLLQEVDRKPYADFVPAGTSPALPDALPAAFTAAATLWRDDSVEVLRQVQEAIDRGALASGYRTDKLPGWALQLDSYFAGAVASSDLPAAMARFGTEKLRGRRGASPNLRHPFFAAAQRLVDAAGPYETAFEARTVDFKLRAISASRETLARLKRERALLSYNDLVAHLARALEGRHGERLAASLRARYRAVLVDEFQDTDPLQARIFTGVFGRGGDALYFVGDPKQAIYGFRGADVRAYLQARTGAERRTLVENFRSGPGLVAAINALFAGADPFLLDAIAFAPAVASPESPAREREVVLPASLAAPFTLWHAPRGEGDRPPNATEARRTIAAATAAEIVRLLAAGMRGEARIGKEVLSGQHIAVLVKSHFEAGLVRDALKRAGVASVTYGQQNVFASREALELERVLLAVASSAQEGLVRAALATDLLGWPAADLARLEGDDGAIERALEDFAGYRDLAERGDFARMLRTLAVECRVAPRLLARDDGERRLTNLLHLAELLEDAAAREGLDLVGVVRYLAQARSAPSRDAESEQLRLESDERLVRILTIHASKGLQFPIVFCPFVWAGSGGRRDAERPLAFHDARDGRARFDLARAPEQEHLELASREALEESLRLAYVALTRAEHRVVAVCGALSGWETSPLAWLLLGTGGDRLDAVESRAKALRDAALRARLDALAHESGGHIAVADLPAATAVALPVPEARIPEGFGARTFCAVLRPRWRVTSYSGLAARSESEAPDHDALALAMRADAAATATADAVSAAVADLPRGARFGEALHALFEQVDFTHLAPLEAKAREVLARFGIAASHAPAVAALVSDVVRTPLDAGGGLRLADVPRERRVDEMEFVLPAAAVDPSRIAAALSGDRARLGLPPADEAAVAGVTPGYLRGFVDVVFAAEGRYWIADYKSNWLGPRTQDYGPAPLARAMAEHLYDLQALLYVIAVDRYLATRVEGYDYERHFGGVFYLFVRGMQPGARHGIHVLRPEAALVRAFGEALTRRGRLVA